MNASITPGGPPVTVSMGPVPGQNALVTFSGTQGQRIALGMSNVTIGTSTLLLGPGLDPEARRLDARLCDSGRPERRLPRHALAPVAGTYTILVDPQRADVGSMTLTLYDVPPDLSGSIAIGGPPISLTLGPVPARTRRSASAGRPASA